MIEVIMGILLPKFIIILVTLRFYANNGVDNNNDKKFLGFKFVSIIGSGYQQQ